MRLTEETISTLVSSRASVRGENSRASFTSRMIRAAKEGLFFIYLYCGYIQLRDLILAMMGRSRAVVLYYHRIGSRDVLTKPADEFRGDLLYLKENYECLSLVELCRRSLARAPFRRRAVAITFDDGYRDNFTEAVPALKSAGVSATFFVSTGFIGTDREFSHDIRAESLGHVKLTWDDLRAMESEGFEIGSHTVNHANLGSADYLTIETEVNDSLAALRRELGARPRAFSFPWGKPEDISTEAVKEVKRAGYYCAASAYGGANSRGLDVFNIRRIDVGNGHLSRLALRARVAGFDPDYWRLKLRKGFKI